MTDAEYALARLRAYVDQAKSTIQSDIELDAYCVVPNRLVKGIIGWFERLDEGMLTAEMHVPHEWKSGCPWAEGGEMYSEGVECPAHYRTHLVKDRV